MNNLVWVINLLHFYFYHWYVKAMRFIDDVNPVVWITRTRAVKRFHAKKRIDNFEKLVNKAFDDEKVGYSSFWVTMHLIGLLVVVEIAVINVLIFITKKDLLYWIFDYGFKGKIIFTLEISILPVICTYCCVLKNSKYLTYFKDFKSMNRKNTFKYGTVSLTIVLLILFLTYLSFDLLFVIR